MSGGSRWLLLGMIAVCGCTASVPSELPGGDGQPGVDALMGDSFLPGRKDAKLLREHARAGELAKTLAALPGMGKVRVHLTLADRSIFAQDTSLQTTVTVVATHSSNGRPKEATIREIVGAAVPGVSADHVKLFLSNPEKVPRKTEYVGPIEVISTSAQTAKLWLGGLLVLCALLAGGMIAAGVLLRRQRLGS